MQLIKVLALASISMLTMSLSCRKDNEGADPCSTSAIESTAIAGLYGSPGTLAAAGESKSYVVTSDTQFAELFGSGQAPAVDFSKFTLLTGKIQSSTGGSVSFQQVARTCQGSYTCTVRIKPGPTTVALPIPYSIVVAKLPPNAQVDFDVQFLP